MGKHQDLNNSKCVTFWKLSLLAEESEARKVDWLCSMKISKSWFKEFIFNSVDNGNLSLQKSLVHE
jgi:hypothetical protein